MSKCVDINEQSGVGSIVCQCDNCCEKHKFNIKDNNIDYKACYDDLRSIRWITKSIGGQWYDFCSEECYQKFLEDKDEGL